VYDTGQYGDEAVGLVAGFETRAALAASAEAVRADAGTLTYAQLNAWANRIAHGLAARGIGPEHVVAVAVDRSPGLAAALLGVLKAGSMYLPLDPGYPAERLKYMVEDARPRCLITARELGGRLDGLAEPQDVMLIEQTAPGADDADPGNPGPGRQAGPDAAAYVIYTSGSTGRPKGVVVPHGALANFLAAMADLFPLDAGDTVVSTTPVSFDIAGLELYLPLLAGARLWLVPRSAAVDGSELRRRLDEAAPALIQGTPALWQLLREAGWSPASLPGAPRLLCGGEALPQDLADFLDSGGKAEVWNMYGPTETTVWSLAGRVRAGEPVSIGSPIRHTDVYVLDDDLREAGPGGEGELYLAGDGLARGYAGQGALTAQRFVACPFGAPGRRMYRTGDVVRRRADGGIDFLGRADEQVKIHGYRIEPGEIEQALLAGGQVAQAKVVVREDRPGVRLLAGYVVPAAGQVPDPEALRNGLREWLPEHMVPAGIEVLDRFPLTPAGKIDRAALPALGFSRAPGRAPATAPERLLVELFEEVLQTDRVGAEDGFFDLGGNSLLATRLIARVRARLGIELPIRTVFEAPTPAGLALALDGAETARSAPHPMPRPEHVPLSYAQQRLWFLHRLEGPSTTYNLPIAVRLDGPLDLPALRSAVGHVVERHESLRTRFREGPAGAEQVLVPADVAMVEIAAHTIPADELAAAIDRAAGHLFDLAEEIPVRIDLFSTGETQHVLLLCIHHIASDGWSLAPLARDLSEAYRAFREGGKPETAPLAVQYTDYTLWQRELLGGAEDPDSPMARQLAYWRAALAGAPELLDLPTDRKRPAAASYQGDVVRFDLDRQLCDQLLALANRHRVSLFMVLQAATATLLTKLGAGTDIPLGSPIAGRPDSTLDELVGFFVNTLVLRTDTSGDPAFTALLERVREGNLSAYAHQDLPFEYLVEVLNPARSSSHHPLFQVMLVLQNNVEPRWELPGLTALHETVPTRTAKFDLTFELTERFDALGRPDGLRGEVEYATDLYDEATVRRLIGYLTRILSQVAAEPDRALSALEILGEAEVRVLEQGNTTDFDEPTQTYPELFQARVARTPDATALICGDVSLTFAELDVRANEVAHWLIGRGVGTEDVVGVALRRTPDLLVCLLGILKAGAVYLPLDPDYPPDRLGFMLTDAAPKVLFTTGEVAGRLPEGATDAVPDRLDFDDPHTAELLAAQPKHTPADAERVRPLVLLNLAYIIYTSGSTGRPKAVAVSHFGIPNHARSYIERFSLDENSRFLQFASINFDPTFCELCGTLLAGACVILCPPEELLAPDRQQATLARYAPTHITFSPTILGGMSEQALAGVPNLMVAGEACPPALAAAWAPGRMMINAYGPTEATIDALYWECGSAGPPAETESVPIGRPLPNTSIYVLDDQLRPVAPGVVGELYIAGHGLARGYLGRPALTAERFVACPYGPPGSRMYRTGDLATRRPDGVVDFAGRVDNQVKLRGMRVEPGEIEAVLAAHPAVAQAVVVIREDTPQHKQLVGYVVSKDADGAPRDPADEIEQVDKWQLIHEEGYRDQAGLAEQEDFTGWNSSYDNEPIPLEQMREWRAATVARILELEPGRVLEVGVGSGLILWQVAPHCAAYHGIDFSPAVVEALRERVDEVEQLRDRVELSCLTAHEVGQLAGHRFDTIVINSVAQYFPSARYLVDVIRESIQLLEPGGRIFLGDIRNLALQRAFAAAIALGNDAHARETAPVLRRLVAHGVELESELLLDPAFFALIGSEVEAVTGVDIRLKRGSHSNELNDFRYDVVLHKRGTELVDLREAPELLTWDDSSSSLETIGELLDHRRFGPLRVLAVPNRRVAAEVEAERRLQDEAA
jgi:amino acid adenylation domain-containing protein